MDVTTTAGAAAWQTTAPGVEAVPVLVIDGVVHVGFDRERVADRLHLRVDVRPDTTMTEADQVAHELAREAGSFARDLELARRVHRSLMPADVEHPDCEVAVRFRPRIGVGGDYASVWRDAAGALHLAVSDVTGHGIASALLVARVNSYVMGRVSAGPAPHEVVQGLNNFLCTAFDGLGLFLTFLMVRCDPTAGTLEWCGAGHPPALVLRADGSRARCDSSVPLLGIAHDGTRGAATQRIAIGAGDLVALYTDGLLEARSALGVQFGENRLCEALAHGAPRGAGAAADAALQAVARHEPGAASDDRLILVAKLR